MQNSFQNAKSILTFAILLHYPYPSVVLSLASDMSDSHVGAILQKRSRVSWQSLAFFSHKLSSTESHYSTFVRELVTAYLAVCHFCFSLESHPFTISTDHKPLVTTISKSGTPFTPTSNVILNSPQHFSLSQATELCCNTHSCPSIHTLPVALATTIPSSLLPLTLL
jgi:hypothetical protein